MLKKMISCALTLVLLLTAGTGALAADAGSTDAPFRPAVTVDGIALDETAWMAGGAVYLPVRAVCTALGQDVQWSDSQNTVTVTMPGSGESTVFDLTAVTVSNDGYTGPLTGSFQVLEHHVYLESGLFSNLFALIIRYDRETAAVSVMQVETNPISLTSMQLVSRGEYLDVMLRYPQIGGLENWRVQDEINAVLRAAAAGAVEEGLDSAYDISQLRATYPDYTGKCETYFSYRVTYNRGGLLCVVTDDYQYAGGAHGMTVRTSYLFDLSTGKRLALADLMAEGAAYLPVMDAAVRAMIDRRTAAGELAEFETGPFETIGENPEFYLDYSGVVLYFQEYAYFPYAAGIQEFSISYSDLAEFLGGAYQLF